MLYQTSMHQSFLFSRFFKMALLGQIIATFSVLPNHIFINSGWTCSFHNTLTMDIKFLYIISKLIDVNMVGTLLMACIVTLWVSKFMRLRSTQEEEMPFQSSAHLALQIMVQRFAPLHSHVQSLSHWLLESMSSSSYGLTLSGCSSHRLFIFFCSPCSYFIMKPVTPAEMYTALLFYSKSPNGLPCLYGPHFINYLL